MKFKSLSLKVPRGDAERMCDLLDLNGFITEIEMPEFKGPATLLVSIPEIELLPVDGTMCDECGGWDGDHEDDCLDAQSGEEDHDEEAKAKEQKYKDDN